MEWLSQTLTSTTFPSTSDFVAVKTIRTLMHKILELCGSRSTEENWQSAFVSMRVQQRPVPVAYQRNTEKLLKGCGPQTVDEEIRSDFLRIC